MTVKTLTGTYSAGYVLSSRYSGLYIAASAEIGGIGLIAPAPATVSNFGTVLANAAAPEGAPGSTGIDLQSGGHVVNFGQASGGQGGSSYYRRDYGYTPAGAGGAGVSVAAGGGVVNHGVATGGAGGAGGQRYLHGDGANGGAGGYGIGLSEGGAAANGGLLTGGAGGAGGDGGPTSDFGGAGGAGGAGLEVTGAAGQLTNNKGVIVGGQGGAGGKGQYNGGFGGYGGAGIFAFAGASVINNGVVRGGMGGLGGATGDHYNPSGYGGSGGDGVNIEGGGSLVNSGMIAGGLGAAAAAGAPFQGPGGGGGTGVFFLPEGGYVETLVNRGSIAGGGGGEGGAAIGQYTGGGLGGYGIWLDGVAAGLDNEGAVSGGAGGDCGYGYRADVGSRGGDGIVFSASGGLLNSGIVTGGHGGAGGTGPTAAVAAGGVGGVGIYLRTSATLTNSGTIAGGQGGAGPGPAGARGDGVVLAAGGSVANAVGGLIEGAVGVYVGGAAATVTNAGAITGDLNSVKFTAPGGLLIAQTGAQFVGAIAGGGGTFELAGGNGTISGLGGAGIVSGTDSASFSGFGSYVIGAGGKWTLTGFNAIAREQSLTVEGTLAVTGTLSLAYTRATLAVGAGGAVTFSGRSEALSGTITGAGTVDFTAGTDTFNGTHLAAAAMAIEGAAVTLKSTIVLTGVLSVATSSLFIGAGGASLTGGGILALSDSSANRIVGLSNGVTLQNFNTISGAGMLGAGQMGLINREDGVIDGAGSHALILDTGSNQIANAGLIEATGAAGVTIESAVLSSGVLEAAGGSLTVNGEVSGPGSGLIASGALIFNGAFSQNVTFSGTSGTLELARSQAYAGAISGFSLSGGTSLDLRDIGFTSSSEASFSGTATSGVLSVTDGSHTAHITLIGDYLNSIFVASSDGHGGVTIVDPSPGRAAAAHRFIGAMATLGAQAGSQLHPARDTLLDPPYRLAAPSLRIA